MRVIYTFIILTILVLAGCTAEKRINQNEVLIATTFYPLYDLTKTIVGEKGNVYSIVPSGVEPHDYEPNPSDIRKLNSAKAFVTLGVEFAQVEKDLIENIKHIKIIPAGKGIQLFSSIDSTNKGGVDPHIWLSPRNAKIMAENIANGLAEADPENAGYYVDKGKETAQKLENLDGEFREGLSNCKKDTILVSHNAFSYLAKDYSLKTIFISGLEPESEPSPQQLAQLIDEAKKNNIKYVFYEEIADPRVAKTIAQEVGAEVLELSPLEGSSDNSATYFTLMRKNLKNLKKALECK